MLFSVIDELNQLRPPNDHLAKNLDTPLSGDSGELDSAALINLIVVTEQKVAEKNLIRSSVSSEHMQLLFSEIIRLFAVWENFTKSKSLRFNTDNDLIKLFPDMFGVSIIPCKAGRFPDPFPQIHEIGDF